MAVELSMKAVFGTTGQVTQHPKLRSNKSVLRSTTNEDEKEKYRKEVIRLFTEADVYDRIDCLERDISRKPDTDSQTEVREWTSCMEERKEALMKEGDMLDNGDCRT